MPIIRTSFVDAQTLAITFEVGTKTSTGKIIPYTKQAGDQYWNSTVVRDGKQIGVLVGPQQNMIHTYDTFKEDSAIDLFKLDNGAPQIALEDSYRITIGGTTFTPEEVFHKANIIQSAQTSMAWPPEFVELHTVHIKLDHPLKEGETVHVDFQSPLLNDLDVKYTPETIRSDAVHVSQAGFDTKDPLKVAFLSTWKGVDAGHEDKAAGVTYAAGTAFHVIDTKTGKSVFDGKIELSQAADNPNNFWQNFNMSDVYKMDFSSVTKAGTYTVVVDGVGKSYDFTIATDNWQKAFENSAHGLYEQRSGIAHTSEFTDHPRPRDHHPDDGVVIKQSTSALMDTEMGLNLLNKNTFTELVAGATDETVNVWGGWRDAADFDRRIQHTSVINELLTLAEMQPNIAKSSNLHIPESKNALPDLIDEALWGLDFFKKLQHADGGVGGGVEYSSHPQGGESSWTDSNQAYAYAPDSWSSFRYAASAAKAAYMVKSYDKARADAYVASAAKAADWALAHLPDYAKDNIDIRVAQNLSYAELYKATGDEKWNKLYLETTTYGHKTDVAWNEHMVEAAYVYATTKFAGVDKTVKDLGIADLLGEANFYLNFQKDDGFMTPFNSWGQITFTGAETSQAYPIELFTRAHMLTGDVKWREALIGMAQYNYGANPMNLSYTTGIGQNQVREIMDLDGDALGKGPIKGITVYGHFNFQENSTPGWWMNWTAASVPNQWNKPINESWLGWKAVGPIDEYTVMQNIGPNTLLTGYLAALSLKDNGGTKPPTDGGTKPPTDGGTKPPTDGGTKPPPTTGEDTYNAIFKGGMGRDTISGSKKADLITAGGNADMVHGGSGNDKIVLGSGNDRGYGGDGNDKMSGGDGRDFISGEKGSDWIYGGHDRDVLIGDLGSDHLFGGADDDTLFGGVGKDSLSGGAGSDKFLYAFKSEGGDTITDFDANDIIELSASGFGNLSRGTVAASAFESRADNLAQRVSTHFIWDKDDHNLWYDSNGKAAGGLTLIAHVEGTAVTAADLLII